MALHNRSCRWRLHSSLYHFTLYYYDQAGNLVRTIPPEGVHLLDASLQEQINAVRKNQETSCDYNDAVVNKDKPTALQKLTTILQAGGNSAMEMWLYNSSAGNNQVLFTTGDNKYLVNTCIDGTYLHLSTYTLVPSADGKSVDATLSTHTAANIQAVTPLRQWTHVVLQGVGLNTNNLSVYVNGKACPLAPNAPNGSCGWEITATSTAITYPENIATLKHIRLYNRLLTATEIAANAGVPCLSLSSTYATALNTNLQYWGRFNVPAAGTATTINGTTTETQFSAVYPAHTLPTSYAYHSLNGVTVQNSPDVAGNSRFWYDRLGRVVFFHNWEQYNPANGGVSDRYSYTQYDAQGRIFEVGEKSGTPVLAGIGNVFLTPQKVIDMHAAGTNTQITKTSYDEAYSAAGLAQDNLRKRVSAVTYQDVSGGTPQQATYYSYDQLGNVKTLWQQILDLGVKRIDYQYDLIAGKVNKVRYQQGAADRFFYNYEYDAENRLIKAKTGINSTSADGWEIENPKTDAAYRYYLHGLQARMELGNTTLVQGLDYAYTLQGWLKSVNGNYLSTVNDMGKDGVVGGTRAVVGRDAYAYTLDYYNSDYQPIGTGQTAITLNWVAQSGDLMGRGLYNGNISRSTLALSNINAGASVGYSYRYDQLNRLVGMRQHALTAGATSWNALSAGSSFSEEVKYDGNGNILNYVRNGSGANGKQAVMDNLSYTYTRDGNGYLTRNWLRQVKDAVTGDPYTEDISNQAANNYLYDNIGNLMKDVEGGVSNIQWTVYGKIKSIAKADGSSLEYRYDAAGNRVYKAYTHSGVTDKTWYVRDAQGTVLAIYGNKDGGSTLYWKEQELYGSSRLGLWMPDVAVGADVSSIWDNLGLKRYELNNHIDNVLATISDKPIQEGDHFKAELLSAQDYYPFGMLQPDRNYSLGSYRYGFNGKENDNEVKGEGKQQDYGMRVYDPRVGRFLSVDPITAKYPMLTSYQFASNSPVQGIDFDGLELLRKENSPDYVKTFLGYTVITNKATSELIKQLAESGLKQAARNGGSVAIESSVAETFVAEGTISAGSIATGTIVFIAAMLKPANSDSKGSDFKQGPMWKDQPPIEHITTDPNNLSAEDIEASKTRIAQGTPTAQDQLLTSYIGWQVGLSEKTKDYISKGQLGQALDYHYEDLVRNAVGGNAQMIGGFEYDAVTDTKVVQAKRSFAAIDNPKNFLNKKTRDQIKRTIELAKSTGKTAEYWFKYGAHKDVVKYIEGKGGKVVMGLGKN